MIATTVFGKHCECIAQKCTHLERLPPLASHLLLPSHCVLTRHGGKKMIVQYIQAGIRTPNTLDQDSCFYSLSSSHSHTQWVVPYEHVNADLYSPVAGPLFEAKIERYFLESFFRERNYCSRTAFSGKKCRSILSNQVIS